MKIIKDMLFYSVICSILLVLISFWGFYWAIFPIKINSHLTPGNFKVLYEHVNLQTHDHITIDAWYIPAKIKTNKAIILLHGYPAEKGDILLGTLFLHEKYNLLYIDFRSFGKSAGQYSTIGKSETLDLLSAVDYLHTKKQMKHIGVWGFSMGGAVAIMGAAQSHRIQAIVVESPYARLDWTAEEYFRIPLLRYPLSKLIAWWSHLLLGIDIHQLSPATSIQHLSIPVFLIYSRADTVVPYRHGQLIQQKMKPNPLSKVKLFNDAAHGRIPASINKEIMQFFDHTLAR